MKKTWETPKLIVLVRNNPQEAVLFYCKAAPSLVALVAVINPTAFQMGCTQLSAPANTPQCASCSALSAS
jgi:hypothetical protein